MSMDAASPDDAGPTEGYQFFCVAAQTREPTRSSDFVSVYAEVLCKTGCATWYCHGSRGAWGDLDLSSPETAYQALVDMPAGKTIPVDNRPTCRESPLLRVEPGAPERSLLYLKVAGTPPCGMYMPPPDSERRRLSDDDVAHIERWILAGAPFEPPDAGPDAQADAAVEASDAGSSADAAIEASDAGADAAAP